MADKTISQLDEITDPKADDELLFLDSNNSNLKKVKLEDLGGNDDFDRHDYPFTIIGKGASTASEVLDTGVISASAFYNNSAVKGVHIGSKVTGIGNKAFFNHSKPDGLTFSEGVTSIGNQAFYLNGVLGKVRLPDSLTSIGNLAFMQAGFTDLKLGQNLTTIGNSAFSYADFNAMNSAGKSLEIPDSVTSIGSDCFRYSTLQNLKIGKGFTSANIRGIAGSPGSTIRTVEISTDNPSLSSLSGCVYDKNLTTLSYVPESFNAALVLPSTCTSIGNLGGYRAQPTSLTLNEGLLSIGSLAFYYGSIGTASTAITFPTSLTGIGNAAFGRCAGFRTITVPNGAIGSTAFYFTALRTGTLGTGVTSVGNSCFAYSNLERLNCNIPLTSIGAGAFSYTSSNLVIHARASDSTWTAGTNLSIKGNTSVDVIKDL